MGEYPTNKPRSTMAKTSNTVSIDVEQELDKLLELAPHLKPLRNARRNEESDADFQSDILENFRRKLRGE